MKTIFNHETATRANTRMTAIRFFSLFVVIFMLFTNIVPVFAQDGTGTVNPNPTETTSTPLTEEETNAAIEAGESSLAENLATLSDAITKESQGELSDAEGITPMTEEEVEAAIEQGSASVKGLLENTSSSINEGVAAAQNVKLTDENLDNQISAGVSGLKSTVSTTRSGVKMMAAPTSGAIQTNASTWEDLEALGTKQADGSYLISGTHNIKIVNNLVARSQIRFADGSTVHISADSTKTIYREKGNTDFPVFVVEKCATLTLANNVVMTGEIAQVYTAVYTLKVMDGYGNLIYQKDVSSDEDLAKTPRQLMQSAEINGTVCDLWTEAGRTAAFEATLANKANGPYALDYRWNSWLADSSGLSTRFDRPMSDDLNKGVLTIIAQWNAPLPNKVFRVTDGYGNVIAQKVIINKSNDDYKKINELMQEAGIDGAKNLLNEGNRNATFANKLAGKSSPYNTAGYTFKEWNYGNDKNGNAINPATATMNSIGGDFTVVANWNEPEKNYTTLTVTDGYGNVIFKKKITSSEMNSNTTPKSIMENAVIYKNLKTGEVIFADDPIVSSGTKGVDWDQWSLNLFNDNKINDGNRNGISWALKDIKTSPHNLDFKFTGWNDGFGGGLLYKAYYNSESDKIDKDVLIAATWTQLEQNPLNTWSDVQNAIATDGYVLLGTATDKAEERLYLGVSGSDYELKGFNDIWYDKSTATPYDRFKITLAGHVNGDDGKNVRYRLLVNGYGLVFTTSGVYAATSWPTGSNVQYKFYLDSDGFIRTYETNNPGYVDKKGDGTVRYNWGIAFNPEQGDMPLKLYSVAQSRGDSTVQLDDSKKDAPGYTTGPIEKFEGTPDHFGYGNASGDNPNAKLGGTTDVVGNNGGADASDKHPINSTTIEPAIYTTDGADGTQVFNGGNETADRGFFVQVNGGRLDIEGATLTNFNAGKTDVVGNAPKHIAPVVVNGGKFNMSSGSIRNNTVSYIPNEANSGWNVKGGGNNTTAYVSNTTPTKSAGGAIIEGGAVASITGNASIKQNRGDAGGVIVRGAGSELVIGGVKNAGQTCDNAQTCDYTEVGGGHIDQNIGFHYAGAVLVEDSAKLRMMSASSTMNYNVAWLQGGAVVVTDFGTKGDGQGARVTWPQGKLLNAGTERWKAADGTASEGIFIMTAGSITGNTAFRKAGAIYVESNSVFLEGGIINDNHSRSDGGAIYVSGDSVSRKNDVNAVNTKYYFDNVYSYSLNIKRGYVGHNYAVSYRGESLTKTISGTGGKYDGKTVAELNDILDTKLGSFDPVTGNPIHIGNGKAENGDKRTANIAEYGEFGGHDWTGIGGGIWMCALGGGNLFNFEEGNLVFIDGNYASGYHTSGDGKVVEAQRGTDIYVRSGSSTITMSDLGDQTWKNQATNEVIQSGKLYSAANDVPFINDTTGITYSATEGAKFNGTAIGGVAIVDNVARHGGAIASNGNVVFGNPKSIYQNDAELEFNKTWENGSKPEEVEFKLFYRDPETKDEVELSDSYKFTLDGTPTATVSDDESIGVWQELNPTQVGGRTVWRAKGNIPSSVSVGGQVKPTYKLKHSSNPSDIIDPSTEEGIKKIHEYALKSGSFSIVEGSWALVVKEYDKQGNLIDNIGINPVSKVTVKATATDIYAWNPVSCTRDTTNSVNVSLSTFTMDVTNGAEPTVEKYINNKVHQNLDAFEETFEYSIMAYVPFSESDGFKGTKESYEVYTNGNDRERWIYVPADDPGLKAGYYKIANTPDDCVIENGVLTSYSIISYQSDLHHREKIATYYPQPMTEIILQDTLVPSLMFVNANGKAQFVGDERNVNSEFAAPIIANDKTSGFDLILESTNNHKGNGLPYTANWNQRGTVSGHNDKNYFGSHSEQVLNIESDDITVSIGNVDGNGNFTNDLSGNTIRVKITGDELKKAMGKWVVLSFDAGIKPSYRSTEKLQNPESGWMVDAESKRGLEFAALEKEWDVKFTTVLENTEIDGLYYLKDTNNRYYIYTAEGTLAGKMGRITRGNPDPKDKDGNVIDFWHAKYDGEHEIGAHAGVNNTVDSINGTLNAQGEINHVGTGALLRLVNYNYPVIEAQVPHHGASNQAQYFVTRNGGSSEYKTNIVTVEVDTLDVLIKKADVAGTALAGASFTLTDQNGKTIVLTPQNSSGETVSEAQATQFYAEDLTANVTYTLTETKAPTNYKGLSGNVTFQLKKGGVTNVAYTNILADRDYVTTENGQFVITVKNRTTYSDVKANFSKTWDPGTTKGEVVFKLYSDGNYLGEDYDITVTDSASNRPIPTQYNGEALFKLTKDGITFDPNNPADRARMTEGTYGVENWKISIKEFVKGTETSNVKVTTPKTARVTIGKDANGNDVVNIELLGYSAINYQDTTVEKYINNKVHEDLSVFDEVFEYSIMAYVPYDAEEVIILDTLVPSLMFVSADGTVQINDNGQHNDAFDAAWFIDNSTETGFDLVIEPNNNHKGDGTGTVRGHLDKGANQWWANNPERVLTMGTGDIAVNIGTVNAAGKFSADPSGDTVRVSITGKELKKAEGKWVVLSFDAAIKPGYRSVSALMNPASGWLTEGDKKHSPMLTDVDPDEAKIVALNKYFVENGMELEKVVRDGINFLAVAKGADDVFYQTVISGDGRWYKTTVENNWTKLEALDGSRTIHTGQADDEKDAMGFQLYGYGVTRTKLNNGTPLDVAAMIDHYNYPVIQAQVPHDGVSNQATYLVAKNNRLELRKTNIVTVKANVFDIKLVKHDHKGNVLKGAQFVATSVDKYGNVASDALDSIDRVPFTLEADGITYTLKDLKPGFYLITEIKLPNGYHGNKDSSQYVHIDVDGKVSLAAKQGESNVELQILDDSSAFIPDGLSIDDNGTIYVKNYPASIGLVIDKVDGTATDKHLEGAEFEIIRKDIYEKLNDDVLYNNYFDTFAYKDGDDYVAIINGKSVTLRHARLVDKGHGSYSINAPEFEGREFTVHFPSDPTVDFSLDSTDQEVYYFYDEATDVYKFFNRLAWSDMISASRFEGNNFLDQTDDVGYYFDRLYDGEYYIREKSAPEGYTGIGEDKLLLIKVTYTPQDLENNITGGYSYEIVESGSAKEFLDNMTVIDEEIKVTNGKASTQADKYIRVANYPDGKLYLEKIAQGFNGTETFEFVVKIGSEAEENRTISFNITDANGRVVRVGTADIEKGQNVAGNYKYLEIQDSIARELKAAVPGLTVDKIYYVEDTGLYLANGEGNVCYVYVSKSPDKLKVIDNPADNQANGQDTGLDLAGRWYKIMVAGGRSAAQTIGTEFDSKYACLWDAQYETGKKFAENIRYGEVKNFLTGDRNDANGHKAVELPLLGETSSDNFKLYGGETAEFTGLRLNETYEITEVVGNNPWTVKYINEKGTITEEGKTATVVNARFGFEKQAADTHKAISGAEFTQAWLGTIADDLNVLETVTLTDNRGFYTQPLSQFGWYLLEETKVPNGYFGLNQTWFFNVSFNEETKTVVRDIYLGEKVDGRGTDSDEIKYVKVGQQWFKLTKQADISLGAYSQYFTGEYLANSDRKVYTYKDGNTVKFYADNAAKNGYVVVNRSFSDSTDKVSPRGNITNTGYKTTSGKDVYTDADGRFFTQVEENLGGTTRTMYYDAKSVWTATDEKFEQTAIGINDGTEYFAIENKRIYELPSSGGVGTYIHTLLGALCISTAAYGIYSAKRRKEEGGDA